MLMIIIELLDFQYAMDESRQLGVSVGCDLIDCAFHSSNGAHDILSKWNLSYFSVPFISIGSQMLYRECRNDIMLMLI